MWVEIENTNYIFAPYANLQTTRGIETIELCIPGVLVQMITSFSLREGIAPTSSGTLNKNQLPHPHFIRAIQIFLQFLS